MLNSIYNIHNPLEVKYLTRLRIGSSHLKEHKFKHNFQDPINPMCSCSSGIETTIHFFLHCANFNIQREPPFDKIATIDANILTENEDSIFNNLLFEKSNCEKSLNKAMLNASIEYIYQLKDLIIHYSNANINYTLSFFLNFILFCFCFVFVFLITRGI